MSSPCTVEAATAVGDMSHTSRATATTTTKPTGMARLAGQRSPTSRTPTVRMGANASRLSRARLSMEEPFGMRR